MRYPSLGLAMFIASAAVSAAAAGSGAVPAKPSSLPQAYQQLLAQHLALKQGAALLQANGGQNQRAQLGGILSELPDQVDSYGVMQSQLGFDDSALVRLIDAEARDAAALAPQDASFPAKVAKVRDDLAQLLSNSTQRYPQLASVGREDWRGSLPSAPRGAASRLMNCASAGFDGTQGCGGSSLVNGAGRSGPPPAPGVMRAGAAPLNRSVPPAAGQTPFTSRSSGLLSGGSAHLDRAAPGIDSLSGAPSSRDAAGDDAMSPGDRMFAGRLKAILGSDPKAVNARGYLARYAALAASGKPDPRSVAAWEDEVKAYLQFKSGGGVMRGVQDGLALAVNPLGALDGKPDTAVAEACWQALAKDHPNFAQGCADHPKSAAMMAGLSQSLIEQAKGILSLQTALILLGTLLLSAVVSGGTMAVIELLMAIGFSLYMAYKIIRDYGPKFVEAVVNLARGPSGTTQSFQNWREAGYQAGNIVVSIAMIFLAAKGAGKLTEKINKLAKSGEPVAASVVKPRVEEPPVEPGTKAAGGRPVAPPQSLVKAFETIPDDLELSGKPWVESLKKGMTEEQWKEYLRHLKEEKDPSHIEAFKRQFVDRDAAIKSKYDAIMSGKEEPPPGITRYRLKLAIDGIPGTGERIPLTFRTLSEYRSFQAELRGIFEQEGITDATVRQRGSGTKGFKTNPKKSLLPWTPKADVDYAVFSEQALAQAAKHGATMPNPNAIYDGKFVMLKNSVKGGAGFYDTPLGAKLDALALEWNKRIYGTANPPSGGIDFKLNFDVNLIKDGIDVLTPGKAPKP
jgi:hypothetical protein